MTRCEFPSTAKGARCPVCGYALKRDYSETPKRRCGSRGQSRGAGQSGLGDYTESLLKSIGVTQDRYKAAKERFGLAPTCNCGQRKAWLNRVGEWWLGS